MHTLSGNEKHKSMCDECAVVGMSFNINFNVYFKKQIHKNMGNLVLGYMVNLTLFFILFQTFEIVESSERTEKTQETEPCPL